MRWLPAKPRRTGRQGARRRTLYGISASPGLAVGKLVRHSPSVSRLPINRAMSWPKAKRWSRRCWRFRRNGKELEIRTRQRLSAAEAAIFAAQRELLADPVLVRDALTHIMQGHGAAWSWQRALRARIDVLQKVADPLLAARALDLRDVGEQVLAQLLGIERRQMTLSEPSILVAEDLTPSDTCNWIPVMSWAWPPVWAGRPRIPRFSPARWVYRPWLPPVPPCWRRPKAGSRSSTAERVVLYLDVNEADQRSVAEVIARQAADRESVARRAASAGHDHRRPYRGNCRQRRQSQTGGGGAGSRRGRHWPDAHRIPVLERNTAPDEDEQYQVYRDMVDVIGRSAADHPRPGHWRRQAGALPESAA
jgi:hypothetical protein